MKNLPKEILNYFATFTETRFNFRRLINYKWSNNELTLDLSLFPAFQVLLLKKIKLGELSSISVKRGDYTIKIDKEEVILEIKKLLVGKFNTGYIDQCIKDEYEHIIEQNKIFVAGADGDLMLAEENEENRKLLNDQKVLAQKEGVRTFNVALRRQFEKLLGNLQDKVVDQKKSELNIEYVPSSIFGIANYVTQQFEQLKRIGTNFKDSQKYISDITDYFSESTEDIIIYDLFYNFQKYSQYAQLGTLFVFFHMLERDSESYPLFFVEVEYRTASSEITLSFPRNLILLNTPAVNYFKFKNVLTVPRASSVEATSSHLGAMETFLQSQYDFQEPFILESSFKVITHANEDFPRIKNRIGLQAITNEDKKLLDYSELMTKLELGQTSKFSEFVDQYVEGKVPNHQEEVDKTYLENYSLKKPKRYVADGPIPVNNAQRRILLALANEKNNIIVVDGPPGTGKSHAIAALTYWANEQKKSVVITSHKKEALDVIDRMLTDKYKSLHPQAKPSIVRMDKETGSANNLQNTLQNSVVGAANERALEYNKDAIISDEKKISTKLFSKIEKKLQQSKTYEESVKKLIEFEWLDKKIKEEDVVSNIVSDIVSPDCEEEIEQIDSLINSETIQKLSGISLEEYTYLIDQKDKIPDFLEACEKLNEIPKEAQHLKTKFTEIPEGFYSLLINLKTYFKQDIKISSLSTKDAKLNILQKIIGTGPKEKDLKSALSQLGSLKFASLIEEIADILNVKKEDITIDLLCSGLEKVRFAISMRKHQALLASYRGLPGNEDKGIYEVYETFRKYGKSKDFIDPKIYKPLTVLFEIYGTLLKHIGVSEMNLGSLVILNSRNEQPQNIWRWIQLHYFLSNKVRPSTIDAEDVKSYYKLKQKDIEHVNDSRLKNFNNHLGEMAKIKVSYEGGKRFTAEEAKVLLNCISCIIAEPSTISKHFPMDENLIDVLIIDEASQVSIADSISLILRAKQVVIFGDEYQYGAVSATNVSARYSRNYFRNIITAYADDYRTSVPEKAQQELVDEVTKEISDDDRESDVLLKPQDGTVLWLKTFNIRTSTLTFAKAIANYTTSLKEHFRSFPEIISYSNDFFYKEAQMELIVNRIRTKPIGKVLQFVPVESQGLAGPNTNLDEIETITTDLKERLESGFKGTVGIITSFKEQQARIEQAINEKFNMAQLRRDHKLVIWFVGDVQGEERDIVYYSFVEAKKISNANLASIYPVIGGTADTIRSLKMQRLNVGFSRAKDTMVFVHSQPIEQFSNTRLGDALKHYKKVLEENKANDFFVEDESVFDSPMEKKLYSLLLDTRFVKEHRENVKIVPQFNIGKYIASEYNVYVPKYRADFLLNYAESGKDQMLILEYDGVEYHFDNPQEVSRLNFSQSYLDYDVSRQLELESYGYRFLRINKFNLRPKVKGQTEAEVLNELLEEKLKNYG